METGPPPYLRVWLTAAPLLPPPFNYLKVWIRHWTFNMHEHVVDKTYAHKGDTVVIVKIREMAVLTDCL